MRRLAFFFLVALAVSPAESRTWTDSTGKYSTEAQFSEFRGGFAYLKKDSGGFACVPLERLSQADQNFVKTITSPVTTITGKVIRIVDGDTLIVLDENKNLHKICLEGIDCPENAQIYGKQAKKALSDKVLKKAVLVELFEKDKYGCTFGNIFLNKRWINKELVEEGWAWHYKQYSKSEVLADAENKARAAKVGLWQDEKPIAPWDYQPPQPKSLVKSKSPKTKAKKTTPSYSSPSYTNPSYPPPSYSTPSYSSSSGSSGRVHVRGYYRKDGTYVRPHTRSRPRR